jgi:hypothetical protein
MQRTSSIMFAVVTLALGACTGDIGDGDDGDGDGSGSDDPVVCEQTRSYQGFGSTPLENGRAEIAPGSDRLRIKPYGALAAEYASALGLATFNTGAYATTFGRPPARWFQEPQASANTLYAAFALAFGACTQYTATAAEYATAPTTATASALCRDLAVRSWHREPTDTEVAACATYSVDQTAAYNPRQRWAYTCASVLSASGFLSY